MIRHPILLAAEALCAALIALLGQLGMNRPKPQPAPLGFALTALGEEEQPDGSWQGADLLRTPGAPVDRFQLTIRPDAAAQLTIDVIDEAGAHRLFPEPGRDGTVTPGRVYALPSPHGFYELDGSARLRVALQPPGTIARGPAQPLPDPAIVRPYPLSDGSHFSAGERAYAAPEGGAVELELRR